MQALATTRELKGHPFDAIDMFFGLLSAVSGSPIAFGLAIGQYFARRSSSVTDALLRAMELPPALEGSGVVHALLPGYTRSLPCVQTTLPSTIPDAVESAVAVASEPIMSREMEPLALRDWLPRVNDAPDDAPHLLVIGGTGTGKTTLVQAILATRSGQVVIADPKWQPGKWGGAPCAPIDDDGSFTQINSLLGAVLAEVRARLVAMKRGTQHFAPLTVVVDEFVTVRLACPDTAPMLLKLLGSIGRELRVRLIALSTSDRVKSLGIEGEGDARENYTIIRLGKPALLVQPACQAQARPACLEWRGAFTPIVTEGVVDLAARPLPLDRGWPGWQTSSHISPTPDPTDLLGHLLTTPIPVLPVALGKNMAESGQVVRDSIAPVQSILTPNTTGISLPDDDESQMIRTLLEAYSKNKVAELLGGSKTTAYGRIKRALTPLPPDY